MPRQRDLNHRQRRFCQLFTSGETAGNIAQSHRKAGYICPTIEGHGANGIRLLKSERIQKEITKLKEKSFSREALSYAEKRAFLARAVRTPVGELHEGSDLAQEVTITECKEGTTKKIKALDKARLIEIDNRMAGHDFRDREPQANNPFLFIVSLGKSAGVASLPTSHSPVIEAEAVEVAESAKEA